MDGKEAGNEVVRKSSTVTTERDNDVIFDNRHKHTMRARASALSYQLTSNQGLTNKQHQVGVVGPNKLL